MSQNSNRMRSYQPWLVQFVENLQVNASIINWLSQQIVQLFHQGDENMTKLIACCTVLLVQQIRQSMQLQSLIGNYIVAVHLSQYLLAPLKGIVLHSFRYRQHSNSYLSLPVEQHSPGYSSV